MPRYEVYATRWDDPHIIEELIPATDLQFTFPLNDHGDCTFTASVEPGKSFWRAAISPPVSGILIARDEVPIWAGYLWKEEQSGPRQFQFHASEWGSFFERVPPIPRTYSQWNDHDIFRDLVFGAQSIDGQDAAISGGTTLGASKSDLTINPWDDTTVEAQFRQLGDADGGPEWYFGITGTLDNPSRMLVLGDRLGRVDPQLTLEYVETTVDYLPPSAPPTLTTLGDIFPGLQAQAVVGGRRGGNVIAHPARVRDGSTSATATIAIGAGSEKAQIRATAQSDTLLGLGYPRLTLSNSYQDVVVPATLQRHATADLNARAGVLTSYTLTTFDDDPDWSQVQRGDTALVTLDTDVYASDRPFEFQARVLDIAVLVPNAGPVQVNYTTAVGLEF